MYKITSEELSELCIRMNGRGYGSYKELYRYRIVFGDIIYYFSKVQSDPYATPSIIEALISRSFHGVKLSRYSYMDLVAVEDYIYRKLHDLLRKYRVKCGSGKSCYLGIPSPSPAMIKRSAVEISGEDIILRFYTGLPAIGRRIVGDRAAKLLTVKIPKILYSFKLYREINMIDEWVRQLRDYRYIREEMERRDIVSFIAENSILPRESSVSYKPLRNTVPFKPPRESIVEFKTPSGRIVRGMPVWRGLTVITGAGYHGKTTLLESIQEGIYPHIPGDGREYVVSTDKTLLVKAEDGRLIHHVDISPHIHDLPSGADTRDFSTMDASGSTSMAASLSEAVEAGIKLILIDEDTSATNLLYKDRVMSKILIRDTITTLAENIESFMEETGMSFIIVSSASSVFLSKTDKIVLMDEYKPRIIKVDRRIIEEQYTAPPKKYQKPKRRIFRGIRNLYRVKPRGSKLVFKYQNGFVYELDLRDNPRIIEEGQTKMIAVIIEWIAKNNIHDPPKELAEKIDQIFRQKGFKAFTGKRVPPDLSEVKGLDVIWVLNRIYGSNLKIEK